MLTSLYVHVLLTQSCPYRMKFTCRVSANSNHLTTARHTTLHTVNAASWARVSAAEECRRSDSHCVHSPTFQTVAHRKNFLSKHKGFGEGNCRMFPECLPLPEAMCVRSKLACLDSDCVYINQRNNSLQYILCLNTQPVMIAADILWLRLYVVLCLLSALNSRKGMEEY